MINLLPTDVKTSYRYARRNVALRNWALILLVACVGLGALATYGLLSLHNASTSYSVQVNNTQKQLQEAKLVETQQRVKDLSGSLKLAVQVLGQEVLFSKLITQIGAVMPSGTNLTGLTINQVSGGLDLTADATSYTTATQVQVNLTDPTNRIFSKVDIVGIICSTSSSNTNTAYPCIVTLRALFNTDNQFLFINQGKKP